MKPHNPRLLRGVRNGLLIEAAVALALLVAYKTAAHAQQIDSTGHLITPAGIAVTGGNLGHPAATGIAAAGTTLATATALTSDINAVSTVASGAGVSLKAFSSTAGVVKQEVISAGANALLVYPPTTGAAIWNLNGSTAAGTAGASVSLAVGSHATFECVSATLCYEAP